MFQSVSRPQSVCQGPMDVVEANTEEGAGWERIPAGGQNDVLSILVQDAHSYITFNA